MKENKTVLVDFTADWCINCHFNEYDGPEYPGDPGTGERKWRHHTQG